MANVVDGSLTVGAIAHIKTSNCKVKGIISQSNGHACKVGGVWYHKDDLSAVTKLGESGGGWRGVDIKAMYPLPMGALLCVSAGSVVDFEGGAIVNAANEGCLGGAGVDGAISKAGGQELRDARLALPEIDGVRCPTGEARMTIGGELKAKFCIHAVGPIYWGDRLAECDELLLNAYQASMACARSASISSVGFSLLSSGIFRGPQSLKKVLEQGVNGIQNGAFPGLTDVHLVAFKQEELDTLLDICDKTFDIDVDR